jgi:hypothetical protein
VDVFFALRWVYTEAGCVGWVRKGAPAALTTAVRCYDYGGYGCRDIMGGRVRLPPFARLGDRIPRFGTYIIIIFATSYCAYIHNTRLWTYMTRRNVPRETLHVDDDPTIRGELRGMTVPCRGCKQWQSLIYYYMHTRRRRYTYIIIWSRGLGTEWRPLYSVRVTGEVARCRRSDEGGC